MFESMCVPLASCAVVLGQLNEYSSYCSQTNMKYIILLS